ncbi:MAG: hypothetical protein IJF38_01500 [Clostridia bacterium]|nr:hypothetical protein [Clostridia bacterium]
MLDYTRAAVDKTIRDIKNTANAITIGSQLIYIAYLTYAIIVTLGNTVINSILLTLSVGYFIFYLIYFKRAQKENVAVRRTVKRTYKYTKLLLNSFTLGTTIWGIYIAARNVSAVSVVLATVSAGGWLISVIIELIVYFVESHVDLIMLGLAQDKRELTEAVTRPVTAVSDFIKRATGHEDKDADRKEEKKPARKQRLLDKLVSRRKEEKARKREEKKMRKQEQRAAKRTRRDGEGEETPRELIKK